MVTVAILSRFRMQSTRWIGALAGLIHHKAGVKAKCANPLGQRMTLRGESLAAVAFWGALVVSNPAIADQSNAQTTKYDVDISGADLLTALPALSRQTGVVVLYPYALAQVRSNPVKGLYTVPEVLQLMLQGTGFSGDVTAQGAVSISRQKRRCDTEGEVMLRDSKSTVSVLALFASLFSASVCAQSAQAQSAAEGPVESVTVSGSRVITDIANSPTPITAVNTEQLLTTTPSNIADGLNKLPVFQNSNSNRNLSSGGGNSSGDFLNLRNFGTQRTLVLLDGMRLPASNQGGSVDVSTLPQTLMSRVDVVTGGASSVYGSDAITGVVNFILDKNFTGFKYEANAGISGYGDGLKYKMSASAGTDVFGGRGHIEGAVEYRHGDGVLQPARPIFAAGLGAYNTGNTPNNPVTNILNAGQTGSTLSGRISCSNCSVNGFEFGIPGVPTPANLGTIPPGQSAIASGGDGATVKYQSIYGNTRHASAFGRFSYKLSDDVTFFAQASLAQANEFNYFFPSQQEPSRQTVTYFKDNAFLPAATQALLGNNCATNPNCHTDGSNTFTVSEWYADPNRMRATNNVTRNIVGTIGLNGVAVNDFAWDAHYTHGETRLSTTGIRNGNNQFHDAQQDAVVENGVLKCWNETAAAIAQFGRLYPGCVPINTFGYNVTTDPQYNYWSRSTHFAETNAMDDIAADISGSLFQLPAGPVKVAVAGEMRWLDYTIDSNASPTQVVDCTGLRLCPALGTNPVTGKPAQQPGTGFITAANTPFITQTLWDNNTLPSVQASENVWEFSGEIGIPILKDVPLIQSLDADIAGRYTNYSISGSVETWKVGLDWHVNDSVRFRGTTSVDIRAPTLNDLYSPRVSASGPFLDPLTQFNPGGIQTITQGNPNLQPESSRTYTGGVVLTPSFIPGLTISADYYQIKLKNAIVTISGSNTTVANICVNSKGTSPFCSLYVRPFPYSVTTPDNYPTLLLSQSLNAAFNVTEGEDYEIDYTFDTADVLDSLAGIVTLRGFVNVAPVNTISNFPGAPVSYTNQPKGHATLFGNYTLGDWSVDAQWHWFSGGNNTQVFGPGQTFYAQPYYTSFSTMDFTLTRRITFGNGSAMSAYFNVQNAFGSVPPYTVGSSGNPGSIFGGIPQGEDVMGRYFTIGIRGDL
jgi:iron complex outermembrane recepter protein